MSKTDTAEVQKQIRELKSEVTNLKCLGKHEEAKALDMKRRTLERTLFHV